MQDDKRRSQGGPAPGGPKPGSPPPAQGQPGATPANLNADQDYDDLERAGKRGGFFGRFSSKLDDALQTSRGPERPRDAVIESASRPEVSADDLAIRRARTTSPQRMVIPEGVIIEGNLTGGTDTEINGRIEGDITVEGRLFLGASALITGNVRAGSCSVDGLVEGKVECSEDLELGKSGRLNADVLAGKRINLAGQVYGNVTTPGVLRLATSSKVVGDLRARNLIMEEGASLNGKCAMRAPSQQQQQNKAAAENSGSATK
jgi:cytoskeletal protein CcmA (bactofilin family)